MSFQCAITIVNNAATPLEILWLAALAWKAPRHCTGALSIGGRWGNEFQLTRQSLGNSALVH